MPTLRPPLTDELPRLRAFLPAPAGAGYVLAADRAEPSPERIVGAAAWWPAADSVSPGEPADTVFCRWRVAPRWEADGRTLPADLLDTMTTAAVRGGARRLRAIDLLPTPGPAAARLAARGWTIASRNEFFEARTSVTWPRVAALHRRFTQSPEGAAVLGRLRSGPPTPDLFPAIFSLVSAKGLVPAELLDLRLGQFDRPGGYSRLTSRVLLTAGPNPRLAAVLLMRLDGTGGTVDARVADPEVCAGAGASVGQANLLLLHSMLEGLRVGGVEFVGYHAHADDHRETVNFARRCGAERVQTSCLWQHDAPAATLTGGDRPFQPLSHAPYRQS